jgi:hypothetical protein
VLAKTSHLVSVAPSTRFSLTSPPPVFSPLAVTFTTLSVTLLGMPVGLGPVTPDDRSAVSIQSGCRSPLSNDDAKVVGVDSAAAVCAMAASARVHAAATSISLPNRAYLILDPPATR